MKTAQQGFTLIELVMVIVILGILAATALPKFVDLQTDAAEAHADSVLGAAKSAAAINYAKSLLDSSNTTITADSTGASTLIGLMDVDTNIWAASTTDAEISGTIASTTYTITISTAESTSAPAVLTGSW